MAALSEAASRGEPVFVSDMVLCELEWVLQSCFGASRTEVRTTFAGLAARPEFCFEDPVGLTKALEIFEASRSELSDCLIGIKAAQMGAQVTMTFDKALKKNPSFVVI